MKFDCIIMNPPYKQGLHLRIVDACMSSLKDDGILVSLCPANSFEKFKFFAPKMSKHLDKIREYVEDIKLLGFKVWNTIGLNVNFCFMTCKQNPSKCFFDNSIFESDIEKSVYKKLSSIYARNKSAQAGLHAQLNGMLRCQITKESPKSKTCIRYKPTAEQLAGKYWTPVRLLHRPSKLTTSLHDAFLWLTDGKPDKAKYFAVFDTKQELDNFKDSLNTYFYRWIYEFITRKNNYNYVNSLPLFTDYTQPMTDEVICKVFGFTDDEFALIKRQVDEAEEHLDWKPSNAGDARGSYAGVYRGDESLKRIDKWLKSHKT